MKENLMREGFAKCSRGAEESRIAKKKLESSTKSTENGR